MSLKRLWRFRPEASDPHIEVRERASEYLDGDASASLAQRIRIHLDECQDCRGFVGTLRATIAALRNLPRISPQPSTKDGIDQVAEPGDRRS
ncbi:MAG: zf-HC2 domain-containing protein [Chloroflexi bacterium]|nr:zf-HC2 domain-containing protein [Chloroflexota bacterium]